ncbi:MAG: hypothetical protein FJ288_13215 [Planctomycetes bacterium]|nr:hypothetical protein [Planctomycetota bacterium]
MSSGHGNGPEMGRREFLRSAAMLGAGLAAGAAGRAAQAAAEAKLEHLNEKPDIVYRRLGRTNLATSALVFGCIKLEPGNLRIVDMAVERGINLVHVSPTYMQGQSIRTLGEWFKKPGNRQRVWLALKPRVDVQQDLPPTKIVGLEEDLKMLNTDHCDLLMMPIHVPEAVLNDDLFKQLEDAKKAGKCRMIGLTFHKNLKAVFENGLKTDRWDAFLPTYSNATRDELKALLPEARKKDIGLFTMKSTRGLPKGADPVPAWRTFLSDGIDTVLKTLTTETEFNQAIRLAMKSEQGGQKQARRANCAGECTLCGACRACPNAVAIQDTLRTYQYYVQQQGWTDVARAQYAEIPESSRASACGDCGRCELVCPANLPVRRMLRQAHAAMA